MPEIAVILNPNSRKNRRAQAGRVGRLARALGARGVVRETPSLDALPETLRELLADDELRYLVADGGDGSLHWVLNESLAVLAEAALRARPLPPIMPTNGGTIDFVARKVGIRGDAENLVGRLASELSLGAAPQIVEVDTLELTGTQLRPDGREQPFRKLGFALAAGGIGQRFFDKYYRERELGAGAIVRVVTRAVASHLAERAGAPLPEKALRYGREVFSPTPARVTIDGERVPGSRHGAIHAGSIDVVLGGVFRVFPLAREPGQLHFQAGDIRPLEIIRAIPELVRGGAIPSRHLVEKAGREMLIEADGELLCPVIDGELFRGLTRLEVRAGPRVRVPRV
ncbi:MAG: diacylglycerol kinase family protein [Sorangiineae bacterium]|nr:diacylglycerol kinase family protein [Polyangiaceae bacterium]MEB2325024.1 diacylglycerol kinase family protein [Sorangiineae bacterium]